MESRTYSLRLALTFADANCYTSRVRSERTRRIDRRGSRIAMDDGFSLAVDAMEEDRVGSAEQIITRIKNVGAGHVGRRRVETLIPDEDEGRVEEAPDPPRYFGGMFRFLPVTSCVTAMEAAPGNRTYVARCLTCEQPLAYSLSRDEDGRPVRLPKRWVFGHASDHDRTKLNHAVIVQDAGSGAVVWMSDYDLTKVQTP